MLMALALSASAQTFTVSDAAGKIYADGDVVNIGYTFDGECYSWSPEIQVTVNEETSLFGGSTFSVTATASQAGIVQFCGLIDGCTILSSASATHTKTYTKGQTFPLAIEILDCYDMLTSEVSVDVKITDGSETMKLTINFLTTEAAGINETAGMVSKIAFSGRTMTYSLESAEKFTLYNISGRAMVDRTLSGSGSLNFTSYPAGVYVYRLGSKTGKVLLK